MGILTDNGQGVQRPAARLAGARLPNLIEI
jgi:hypothetical protein